MGTFEADKDRILRLQPPTEVPELGFSSSSSLWDVDEEFVEKFQNAALELDSNAVAAVKDTAGLQGSNSVLPLRPYAGDCPYYIRTGACKFGFTCRFNHPVKRSSQSVKENMDDCSSENSGKIECKYYLTPGGCKFGKFCRYSHSKDESETAPLELNFLGLPIRLGEKECPYYMRFGSCGYGARCVFHHPEPISIGGFDLDEKSMTQSGYSLGSGSSNSEPASLLWKGASQSDHSPYMNSFPKEMHRLSNWNGYQALDSPHGRSSQVYWSSGARADLLVSDITVQVEEFPERPGHPVCAYFLKTGDCKFKSACRFHHPKDWVHKSDVCALSDMGLPLRPGKNVCRHYERFGICKFGPACLFDHPMDLKFSN